MSPAFYGWDATSGWLRPSGLLSGRAGIGTSHLSSFLCPHLDSLACSSQSHPSWSFFLTLATRLFSREPVMAPSCPDTCLSGKWPVTSPFLLAMPHPRPSFLWENPGGVLLSCPGTLWPSTWALPIPAGCTRCLVTHHSLGSARLSARAPHPFLPCAFAPSRPRA